MTRKNIWRIVATMSLSVFILIALLFFAPPLPNQRDNGFTRIWVKNLPELIRQVETEIPVEAISGATEHHIFISTSNPVCLIRQNYSLDKFDTIYIPINPTPNVLSGRKMVIDSPWSYLFLNNEPGFVFGKLNDSTLGDAAFMKTKQLFVQSVPLSPSTVVVRTFDSLQSKQIFQKVYSLNGEVLAEEEVFENQTDRGFGTGGILRFDETSNLLVYVQSYQNQFIILDTNLVVAHRFNTIDTTFTNDVSITQARIDGREKLVPAKARINVNKNAFVSNGLLFIAAGLRADNETLDAFNNNSAIDIYQINNGKYLGSFYIPSMNTEKMKDFMIKGDTLVVLYKKNIAIFKKTFPTDI